jgi:hypothetical protein
MSREVLDSRSSYDELYDDRPERDRGPRPPRRFCVPRHWLTKLRSLAPLLVAFAVGLAVGGAGWNEWLAQREAAAARSAVSFTAEMSSADATRDGIEAYVRLRNTGPETVLIDELQITDTAIRSSSRSVTKPLEALPDKRVTSRLFLEVDCSLRASSEPMLSMRVRTVDGVARSTELPIDDDNNWLQEATTFLCPDPNDTFIPLEVSYNGTSGVIDAGGPALQMRIAISTWTPIDVTVLTMSTASSKLSVAVDGLPLEIDPAGDASTNVLTTTWGVVDCRNAEDLRYEELGFVVEAQRPGGIVVTTRVRPDPNLALDVAKFVNNTCRAA